MRVSPKFYRNTLSNIPSKPGIPGGFDQEVAGKGYEHRDCGDKERIVIKSDGKACIDMP